MFMCRPPRTYTELSLSGPGQDPVRLLRIRTPFVPESIPNSVIFHYNLVQYRNIVWKKSGPMS